MIPPPGDDPPGGGGGGGGSPTPPPTPGQGWIIDATADTITFNIAPASGTNNIFVQEFATGALTGSTKFAIGAWCDAYGFPREIEFFSDRLWFAGSRSDPQTVWASQTGDYSNFGHATPIVDSDAVTFQINSRQVNAVMDMVPLDKMLIFAKGGEFMLRGGQDDVITPSTISVRAQSYLGSDGTQAKVTGDTAILVREQGQHVYDIGYQFESDGYRPRDLSIWASHLTDGHAITCIEWMPAPWQVLWFVRDDGQALGCTYMPEQEVIGWHRHDTGDGDQITDMVCLPGVTQTEVFALTSRTISGVKRNYIEQMAPFDADPLDWCYMDAALTYDGRNTTATTVRITGGSQWTETELLTLTASSALFVGSTDVGDGFLITNGTDSVRVKIAQYTSATVVKVNSIGTVPSSLRSAYLTGWTFQRDSIGGLSHLEGRQVAILSDGSVHRQMVVSSGVVALDSPGGVVTVGLPYRGHIETLPLNVPGGETVMDSKKLLNSVSIMVENTRGVKVCAGELRDEYTYEIPQRETEGYADPTQAQTGMVEVGVSGEWGDDKGRFHVISDDPLPMEVLTLIPRFMLGNRPG